MLNSIWNKICHTYLDFAIKAQKCLYLCTQKPLKPIIVLNTYAYGKYIIIYIFIVS